LLSLGLVFAAFRYQPGFGPLAVAYAAANIARAIPHHAGRTGRHRSYAANRHRHRRLRRAAADGDPRRPRLPDRELLASAASRDGAYIRIRLSPKAADREPAGADGLKLIVTDQAISPSHQA
jgi:hypothetical protein